MADILVWAADTEQAFELLAKAREFAPQLQGHVVALALGDAAGRAQDFVKHGADRVLTAQHDLLKGLQVEPHTDALHQAIQAVKPSLVLVGLSIRAKDVAGRVGTRLEVGVGSDMFNLRLEGGRVVGERMYFSGNSILTEKLLKDPQIVIVPPRVYEAQAADASRQGKVEPFNVSLKPPKAKVVQSIVKKAEGVHLEQADVIVSVGRGVKKKEDIAMIDQLAKVLDGAVGCTRPIAADLKWLGDEHWIGLSGHEVKPKAYIGLGVSGQIQHVAGMRGSKLIIAINKDEEAPLVKISDYAIVDDLYKVVPALTKEVQKIRGG